MKKRLSAFEQETVLECEKLQTFLLLMCVSGFLGAYTLLLRGGVFCNAQTANFVLLAIELGKGSFKRALYYLIPISAYLAGAVLSEFLPKRINRLGLFRWDTVLIGFEMLCLLLLSFVPDNAPPQICQVVINFIASMQYNTFRQATKVSMATTFCTNHLRQVGVNLVKWVHKHDREAGRRLRMHLLMLVAFVAGSTVSAFLCVRFGGRALLFVQLLLLIVFLDLLHADLSFEKDKLHIVPHGH